MELKLGVMTNKELADWFGIKEGSFRRNKDKKLEELRNFAEFERKKGKIEIKKIIEPVYSKRGSEAYQIVKNEIDNVWSDSGLDSCSRVSEEIGEKCKNELMITQNTIYNYTRKGRNELYGVPCQSEGSLGRCTYLLCKKIGDGIDAVYEKFTEDEEKIKDMLMKKYFGNLAEKTLIVSMMVERGEIRKEDMYDELKEVVGIEGVSPYVMFLNELKERLGCNVVRGTLVERIEGRGRGRLEMMEEREGREE